MSHTVAVLDIHICDQRRSYKATFATEAQALTFLKARTSTHAFRELEGGSIPITWSDLYDFLYPLCEHNLPGDCYGPQHYYVTDEERAAGYGAF
jgi:hypothetical protein